MSYSSIERTYNYKHSVSSKLYESNSPARRLRNKPKSSSITRYFSDSQKPNSDSTILKLISETSTDTAPVPLAKEIFYDLYSMGSTNLSNMVQPPCVENIAFLKAPESYNEILRLNSVERYMNLPHWGKTKRFSALIKKMRSLFNVSGAAISLIDTRSQICKFEEGYGFRDCSRQISIDSHTILSHEYFTLLDASKDWRFKSNPLVKDIPSIRYYLGVPLFSQDKQAIGVLSIFDRNPRKTFNKEVLTVLQTMSIEIMDYLNSNFKLKQSNSSLKTGRMLKSTCVSKTSVIDIEDKYQNRNKLLEQYGRATGGSMSNKGSIFERDGSGTSYNPSSNFKLTKYSLPYEDLIDLNVWNDLSKCVSFTKACFSLCNYLQQKLNYDCIYISNMKVSKPCWINIDLFPKDERIINVSDFKHVDAIQWEDERYKDEVELNSSRTHLNAITCSDKSVENTIRNNQCGCEFHNRVIRSNYGLEYHSSTKGLVYHSGYSLPFYKYGNKLIRKQRSNKIQESKNLELFFKSSCYLITCLNKKDSTISESEIGYVYGCVSLLRKIFLC